MIRFRNVLLGFSAAAALIAAQAVSASVIKPVSVATTINGDAGSSHLYLLDDNAGHAENGLERPIGTANTLSTGDALVDALATVAARSGTAHAESWTANTPLGNPVFTFDLTGAGDTSVGSTILWQYGNNGGGGAGNEGNETREFSLDFRTDAEGTAGAFATDFSSTMASIPGDGAVDNVAQFFGFGAQNARYILLRIDSNYGGQQVPGEPEGTLFTGGDRYGLGEVRFASEVPEPASMALFGLGGLLVLRRKRA